MGRRLVITSSAVFLGGLWLGAIARFAPTRPTIAVALLLGATAVALVVYVASYVSVSPAAQRLATRGRAGTGASARGRRALAAAE